jgi:hypothetical protein
MSVLIIGATERDQIAKMKAEALKNPVPLALIMQASMVAGSQHRTVKLTDRDPKLVRPESQHIVFPGGSIRAAFSFEEQPAGLFSHLSISLMRGRPGQTPAPAVVEMICEEFGVPFPPDRGWLEEYEPGYYAVNLVSLYEERVAGTA